MYQKSHWYIGVLVGLFLVGCASQEEKVSLDETQKLDREFVAGTGNKNETVGEKDGTIVIQKKVSLQEDMSKVADDIDDLENSIYGLSRKDPGGLWLKLKECRKKVSDVRLGGNGVPDSMEAWEKPSATETDTKYRLDKKKYVVAVSEEQLEDRLTKLKNTKNTLERRYSEFKDKLDACEEKYQATLVKHGLDPEDTKAEGEWVTGPGGARVWQMKKAPTSNPEELMRRKEEREKRRKESN
jgi:predicted nuclease with TOPRIM domain